MLYLNGSFKTNIQAPQNYYNFTDLTPDTLYELGTHTVDTSGNINSTWKNATARTLPLPDTEAPAITFIPPTDPSGAVLTTRNWTFINVSLSEPGFAWLEWNGINESMLGSGTDWYINKTDLASGVYTYRVRANDSAGNVNASETRQVTVNVPAPVFNISGYKINDTSGSGAWDAGEAGIAGWNITLRNATNGAVIASASTDASGFYRFAGLAPGSHNVTEEARAGWFSTNATFRVIAISGQNVINLNFTNRRASIYGIVFNDTNANKIKDAGEGGLAGWTINIMGFSGGRMVRSTAVTGANGNYMFANLSSGTYFLMEGFKPGWMATTPFFYMVKLEPGGSVERNFGSRRR